MTPRSILSCSTALLAAGALAALPAPALAGTLSASAESCSAQVYSTPFARFADPLTYVTVPSGPVEGALSGWKLSGGAQPVAGNESFNVHGALDRSSLSLPAGSSVTTRALCVGLLHPTLRIFARNTGSVLSTLKVEALFEAPITGTLLAAPIGLLVGGSTWAPSLPMVIAGNLLAPTMPGGFGAVAFRMTPLGTGGQWRIDDLYVDPRRTN